MKVKLLSDIESGDKLYKDGAVIELNDEQAEHFINLGAAVETDESTTEDPQEAQPNADYPKVVDGVRYEYDKSEPETPILAVFDATFENLQESPSGYGADDEAALVALRASELKANEEAAKALESDSSTPPFNPNDQAGLDQTPNQPAAPVVPNGLPLSSEQLNHLNDSGQQEQPSTNLHLG